MTPPNTLTMLAEFGKGGGAKAFTGMAVTHAQFAAQVRSRIERPYEIYQGNASLCGPAAFMYCLIKKNAMAYAKYAMDLFATGTAWLGHLHIKPSADCKRSEGESLLAVDWVTLAGLRDSENSLLEYDSPTDRVAGITNARTQAGWLGRCGYFAAVARETNAMRDKPLSALLRAQQHRSAGSHPCLLIGANVVTGTARGRAFPNHWVVLGSDVKIDGIQVAGLSWRGDAVDTDKELQEKRISMSLVTWGENRALPPMTVGTFLDYFYGYVVGR